VAGKSGIDLSSVSPEDLISTVTELSAVTIADFIRFFVQQKKVNQVYVSGGGLHNPVLLKRINKLLGDVEIKGISALGIDPDAKEAVIFAVLANEMLSGEGFSFDTSAGKVESINFGKISLPN
jgi:anhydro-N-acetylmuramic acid kinase